MKYGNRKTVIDGITFDSKKEARRYSELKLLEAAGEIAELELQPTFTLTGRNALKYKSGRLVKYKADFRYYDIRKQVWIIEDAKGMPTPAYKLKAAIMADMGVPVTEV